MNIVEAIKRLEARVEYGNKNYPTMNTDDVKLGIEALKYIQKMNSGPGVYRPLRLPGETEE